MDAVGNLIVYSLAMIVLPVGGFFGSKAVLFESMYIHRFNDYYDFPPCDYTIVIALCVY